VEAKNTDSNNERGGQTDKEGQSAKDQDISDERKTEKLSEVHIKRMGERIGEGQREWEKNKENRREGRGE